MNDEEHDNYCNQRDADEREEIRQHEEWLEAEEEKEAEWVQANLWINNPNYKRWMRDVGKSPYVS